jgi:uncharacterized membrane protein YdjX (TVP38/TMEM64 family)
MLTLFAQVEWPSAIIGVVLLLIIAAIMIIAMFRYDLDGVLKLWAAIGTLFGLVIGSMATYFFTNQAQQAAAARFEAEKQTLVAQHQAAVAEKEKFALAATEALGRSRREYERVKGSVAQPPAGRGDVKKSADAQKAGAL